MYFKYTNADPEALESVPMVYLSFIRQHVPVLKVIKVGWNILGMNPLELVDIAFTAYYGRKH